MDKKKKFMVKEIGKIWLRAKKSHKDCVPLAEPGFGQREKGIMMMKHIPSTAMKTFHPIVKTNT